MNLIRAYLTFGVGPWVRFVYFRQFVRSYLIRRRSLKILDAGFGNGDHIGWLGEQCLPDTSLVGYDISAGNTYANNLEMARKKINSANMQLFIKDLREMRDKDVFDVIYGIDVLEHIPDNETVMQNIFNALKEGGIFYLAMPYDREKPSILPKTFLKRFRARADEEHIGEMRSLPETEDLLKRIGFTVLESRYTFGFIASLMRELGQFSRTISGGPLLFRLAKPVLNGLAALEFICPESHDGNLRVVCQK